MHWQYKAVLQLLFSNVPEGERLNYWFQRHVTRSLPLSDESLSATLALARDHARQFETYGSRPLQESTFYEFGAGWDLAQPLSQSAFGVRQLIAVDIRRLARRDLVVAAIAGLRRILPRQFPVSDAGSPGTGGLDQLLTAYRIQYLAPCDARATGLPAQSIDCITSTNTLEHIPPSEITAVLVECRRILRDDGVMSFQVDYNDHWSYLDPTIPYYHFLRYSERAWRCWSPSLHYQNRLRHRDYQNLYEAAGFDVVKDEPAKPSSEAIEAITHMALAPRFRGYSPAELAVPSATVVLRKRPG